MATIGNANEATFSDGSGSGGDVLNIDTLNGRVQIPNNKVIQFYSDAYSTAGMKLTNTGIAPVVSATTPDPGAAGTISTAGLGVSRVTPAAARTGIILEAGSYNGQEVTIINEAAAVNSLTLNTTPATSNVADSATESAIAGLTARKYVWLTDTSLWYPVI